MAKKQQSRQTLSAKSLREATSTQLLVELERRRCLFLEERAKLMARVEEIDEHLAALGMDRTSATRRSSRTTKKRRRTRSSVGSLADTLHTVL